MAFVVEDGTGLSSATAYIEVAFLRDYAATVGYDVTTKTDPELQVIISRVTLGYIDVEYTFKGEPLNENQALKLPTDEVTINDKIRRAVADACIVALKGALFPEPSNDALIKKTRRKLADLETETEYTSGIDNNDASPTPVTDSLLQPYLAAGSGVIGTVQVW